jgi:hypothetical protein
MSDAIVTPESQVLVGGAQVVGAGPAAVITPGAPAATPAPEEPEKHTWLPARLERERKAILKELGVETLDDGKKAVSALRAQEEAAKTTAQKAAELEASLKTANAEKAAYAEAIGAYAKTQMSALSESQRNAVTALAGEDAARQLKTIEALRPTWASAAQTPAPVKDTAPAPSAPKDAGSAAAPSDKKAVYESLLRTNPVVAARYGVLHNIFDEK